MGRALVASFRHFGGPLSLSLGSLVYKRREVGLRDTPAEVLEDVRVNYEAVIFGGGRIYPESFAPSASHRAHWQRPSRYAWFLFRNYVQRRDLVDLHSAMWIVDDMSIDNYYHWLIDCLARLVHGETLCPGETTLLLPGHLQRNPFVEYTLQAFPRMDVRWVGPTRNVRVHRLSWVPRSPPYYLTDRPTFRRDLVSEVARRVGELAGSDGEGRRFYFSRANTGRRRALNEDEVVRAMRDYQVEVIHIDGAKPWEQIRMARRADLIVGVHGAALSNLVFLPPHGRVLELHRDPNIGDTNFYDVFGCLAREMGLGHTSQLCEIAAPASRIEDNHADLVVDIEQLRNNLRTILS